MDVAFSYVEAKDLMTCVSFFLAHSDDRDARERIGDKLLWRVSDLVLAEERGQIPERADKRY